MSDNSTDKPEQIVTFAPKGQRPSYGTPVEEAGEAIVAKIQRAAELANETCDRAMKLAHKLSMDLRAAEDRINQLEAEVQLFRDRSARAEGWLQTIYKEIEEKLIAPRSGSIEGSPDVAVERYQLLAKVDQHPREDKVGCKRFRRVALVIIASLGAGFGITGALHSGRSRLQTQGQTSGHSREQGR